LRQVDHQFAALVVAQLVVVVAEVVFRGQPGTLFQGNDFEPSLCQMIRRDPRDKASTDSDNINLLVLCHR
jgi:hypothetical protein